jgi:hypothetical protein
MAAKLTLDVTRTRRAAIGLAQRNRPRVYEVVSR